jgi:hypothetical protein
VILTLIILSSIKLIYGTYVPDLPPTDMSFIVSNYIDLVFTISFAVESLIKSLGSGFLIDKGTYLRETWNQLDFFIVVTSLIDLLLDGVDLPVIKILRLLRTLRPLRFISHNSAMKTIVTALFESVGAIVNVVIVILVVWLMFAILAVNLFGGKLQYCDAEDIYAYATKEDCVADGLYWRTFNSNFDDVP